MPGFSAKDIEVTVEPRRLTISGWRELTVERKQGKAVRAERRSNQFYRAMDLPAAVDTTRSALEATCDHGVLTITLPKADTATGRQITGERKSA